MIEKMIISDANKMLEILGYVGTHEIFNHFLIRILLIFSFNCSRDFITWIKLPIADEITRAIITPGTPKSNTIRKINISGILIISIMMDA